jgi:hypothetical protein
MTREEKRLQRKMKKAQDIIIEIQAMAEGAHESVDITSLLTGERLNDTIGGTTNTYKDYDSQVWETYKKYNNHADWGNQQTRMIVDYRTSFISGEGISVDAKSDQTEDWIYNLLEKNHFDGSMFIDSVKATEMAGQTMYVVKPEVKPGENGKGEIIIKIYRQPYSQDFKYTPKYTLYGDRPSMIFLLKDEMGKQTRKVDLTNTVPVVTGGDDLLLYGPTTRIGSVLVDCENYDRAVKDARRLNHYLARITPTFQTKTGPETKALLNWLTGEKWKVGKAYVGTAEFSYEGVDSHAHDNLQMELVTNIRLC